MDRSTLLRGSLAVFLLGSVLLIGVAGCTPVASGPQAPSTTAATGTVPVTTASTVTPRSVSVPNVVGQTKEGAIAALSSASLNVTVETKDSTKAKGLVIAQEPSSGHAQPGTMVTITVSSGPELVTVPNVQGKMYDTAESKLKAAGLKYREKINAEFLGPADDVQDGGVYKQSPAAGRQVPKGTVITIYFNIYE